MSEKVVQIKKFYSDKAASHRSDAKASMPDKILIDKEIEILSGYLKTGMHLLDVGCANGYSTFRLAEKARIFAKGIDYVENMIRQAEENLANWNNPLGSSLSFAVGDVTTLLESDGAYDVVLSKRCIINLPSWKFQQKALDEMLKPLRSGGLLLLSEAFENGWRNMNKVREFFNLKEIPQPWHNLYLSEEKVKSHLKNKCR
ncbi:MAG: class I SAM-dependent methyltransferase, partial [Candidatus Omnitrophica bacterium]|nr:class I SAM-dependent methyltransferase [Candidatus Omnitrophota bacterium]